MGKKRSGLPKFCEPTRLPVEQLGLGTVEAGEVVLAAVVVVAAAVEVGVVGLRLVPVPLHYRAACEMHQRIYGAK